MAQRLKTDVVLMLTGVGNSFFQPPETATELVVQGMKEVAPVTTRNHPRDERCAEHSVLLCNVLKPMEFIILQIFNTNPIFSVRFILGQQHAPMYSGTKAILGTY